MRRARILARKGAGFKDDSLPDSNQRRLFIRLCLVWALGYGGWLTVAGGAQIAEYSLALAIGSTTMIAVSLLIFVQIVLLMPFKNSDGFEVDARRLLFDTIVSSIFMISVFSLLYRNLGLVSNGETIAPTAIEAIYFSAVTFSTLGYGDFAPTGPLRLVAACEALLGNLHLGMVVGSTFATFRSRP